MKAVSELLKKADRTRQMSKSTRYSMLILDIWLPFSYTADADCFSLVT
jgi:hypothetical protein